MSEIDSPVTSGLTVWRVSFKSRFDSSSGMERYSINHPERRAIVITAGDSLSEVKEKIRSKIGLQNTLTELTEATFIGTAL